MNSLGIGFHFVFESQICYAFNQRQRICFVIVYIWLFDPNWTNAPRKHTELSQRLKCKHSVFSFVFWHRIILQFTNSCLLLWNKQPLAPHCEWNDAQWKLQFLIKKSTEKGNEMETKKKNWEEAKGLQKNTTISSLKASASWRTCEKRWVELKFAWAR